MHGSVGQCSTVRCVLYRWCDAGIGGGGRGPGSISGAGGFPGASVVAVGVVLLLLLSLLSGCGLMLLIRLHSGLFGAACYFVSAAPVRVGCFLSLPALWGLVLKFCYKETQ